MHQALEGAEHRPSSSGSSRRRRRLRHASPDTYSSSQYGTVRLRTVVTAASLSVVSPRQKAMVLPLLPCPKHRRLMLLISALQLPHNPISGDAAKGNVGGGRNAGFVNAGYAEQRRNGFFVAALLTGLWCFEVNRHHTLRFRNPEPFKGRREKIWQQAEPNWR